MGRYRSLVGVLVLLLLAVGAANASTPIRRGGTGWDANAAAYADRLGAEFRFGCPPYGTVNQVWGTGIYTTDSSVCTAAVHDGLIRLTTGGQVVIRILPGRSSYRGTSHDGMTSMGYGSFGSSYVFVGTPAVPSSSVGYGGAGWSANVTGLNASVGQEYMFVCPANGAIGAIWGTTVYTDDSSVCSAAVHAGFLQRAKGGLVTVRVVTGARSYRASTQNGVTSGGYGKNGTEPAYNFVTTGVQMNDQWDSTA